MKTKRLCYSGAGVGVFFYAVTLLTGCAWIQRLFNPVDQAVNEIDRGIDAISNNSTKWQATLKEVSEKLPTDIQQTIRNEMSQLVERSIAVTGEEFRCNTDFLGKRAIQGLERIKTMLTGGTPPPIQPSFCQVSPGTLDVNAPPDSRKTILIAGYDLDARDSGNHLLSVVLFADQTGEKTKLSEDRVGRTTHYVMWLNVAGNDFESLARTRQISKIRFEWNGNFFDFPQVLVIPRVPKTQSVLVPLGEITHTPRHVEGDRDFDTHDDEPMSFHVIGQSQSDKDKISVRAYMRAREERSDWTTVDSWSDWQTAYSAPPGWRIIGVARVGQSEKYGSIADHGIRAESLPQGEIINRFDVYGDQDGDDTETYTRVKAYFNPVTVYLEEIIP